MSEGMARLFADLDLQLPEAREYPALLPAVEALCARGYIVLLKWDGLRDPAAGDNGQCTVLISGGDLAASGDFFRTDALDMTSGLNQALEEFAAWWDDRR